MAGATGGSVAKTRAPPPSAAAPRPALPPARVAEDPRCVTQEPRPPVEGDADTGTPAAAPAPAEVALAQASRARLLARMKASADPYANAVAGWLDVGATDDAAHAAQRDRELASRAASTRDPRLYALALRTCWRKADRECASLSARRWSELDPGNALPWLMMLDEATARRDASGQQEAMFHVAHAQRLAERPMAPVQPIVDAAEDDPGSLAAARALAIDAIGISAAEVWPAGFRTCVQATPGADANFWQQCVQMVDLLEHRSDTLMARMMGASLDRRMTGNVEPGKMVSAQLARLMTLHLESSASCDDLRTKVSVLRRMAMEGEAAFAEGLVH